MFDKVKLKVISGEGGDGIHSFHREKFVPLGGPDGGDGGHGGDVIVCADSTMSSLVQYQYHKPLRAGDGGNGQKNKKHGKNGADLMVKVPVGTVVYEDTPGDDGAPTLLVDMVRPGQEVVVARGGKAGAAMSISLRPPTRRRGWLKRAAKPRKKT